MNQVEDEVEEDPGEGEIIHVEEVVQILIGNVVEGEDVVVDIEDQEPLLHALDLIADLYANENAEVGVDNGTVEHEFGSPVKFGASEVDKPRIIAVVPNVGKCFKLTDEDSSLELIRIHYEDVDKEWQQWEEKEVQHALEALRLFYNSADQDDADKHEMKIIPSSGIISFGLNFEALNCSSFGGEALEVNAPAPAPVPVPAGT